MGHRPGSQSRMERQRQAFLAEAARLMVNEAIADPALARRKAARRLGYGFAAEQLRDAEIDAASRDYRRLFTIQPSAGLLLEKREAALEAMEFLSAFAPRLAGPVLEGGALPETPVSLHLHPPSPDAPELFLDEQRIPVRKSTRHMRMSGTDPVPVAVLEFNAGDVPFELLVLPESALRQPPIDPLSSHAQKRASAVQLRTLIEVEAGGSASP